MAWIIPFDQASDRFIKKLGMFVATGDVEVKFSMHCMHPALIRVGPLDTSSALGLLVADICSQTIRNSESPRERGMKYVCAPQIVVEREPIHEVDIMCVNEGLPGFGIEPSTSSLYGSQYVASRFFFDYDAMEVVCKKDGVPKDHVGTVCDIMGLRLVARPATCTWKELSLKIIDEGLVRIFLLIVRCFFGFENT